MSRGQFAVGEIAGEINAHPRQPGLVERGIDNPALAGAAALLQCRQDADHRPHPGAHVDDRGRHPDRWPPILAEQAHQPAIGLHHRVVAGLVAQRPHRAERTQIAEDEARLRGHKVGAAEPVSVERAEFEIVQHDIGALQDQRLEPRRVLRIGEIDRDAALGAVDRVKARRRPFHKRRPPAARRVAGPGVLDLDHLGPQLAEDHPGIRRRNAVPDLDNDKTGQRFGSGHPIFTTETRRAQRFAGRIVEWIEQSETHRLAEREEFRFGRPILHHLCVLRVSVVKSSTAPVHPRAGVCAGNRNRSRGRPAGFRGGRGGRSRAPASRPARSCGAPARRAAPAGRCGAP